MGLDYLSYSYAVIADDDAELLGRAAGLIRAGLVYVRPRDQLTLAQCNEGSARVGVMLRELQDAHERLTVEASVVKEQADDVARRLERRTGKPATAQEIVDATYEKEKQRARRARKQGPARVSKDDARAIGEHAESIARGDTRVE